MQQWYKQYPDYYGQYANATLEMAVAEIKREIMAQYLGSAIADALTYGADTAAAIQAAPPSVLQEFMEGLGIDPEILGKTPMPSTHSMSLPRSGSSRRVTRRRKR